MEWTTTRGTLKPVTFILNLSAPSKLFFKQIKALLFRDIKTSGLLFYLWIVNMAIEINTYKIWRMKKKLFQPIQGLQML